MKDEDVPSYSINPRALVIWSIPFQHSSTSCRITGAQECPFTYIPLQSNDASGMLAHCQKPKAGEIWDHEEGVSALEHICKTKV